jgi:hypothetical protein
MSHGGFATQPTNQAVSRAFGRLGNLTGARAGKRVPGGRSGSSGGGKYRAAQGLRDRPPDRPRLPLGRSAGGRKNTSPLSSSGFRRCGVGLLSRVWQEGGRGGFDALNIRLAWQGSPLNPPPAAGRLCPTRRGLACVARRGRPGRQVRERSRIFPFFTGEPWILWYRRVINSRRDRGLRPHQSSSVEAGCSPSGAGAWINRSNP